MECASCDALGKEHKAPNIRLWKRIRTLLSVKRRVRRATLQDMFFIILDFDGEKYDNKIRQYNETFFTCVEVSGE